MKLYENIYQYKDAVIAYQYSMFSRVLCFKKACIPSLVLHRYVRQLHFIYESTAQTTQSSKRHCNEGYFIDAKNSAMLRRPRRPLSTRTAPRRPAAKRRPPRLAKRYLLSLPKLKVVQRRPSREELRLCLL